eukprot:352785-Chlamydomonas_euryale.AAC.4
MSENSVREQCQGTVPENGAGKRRPRMVLENGVRERCQRTNHHGIRAAVARFQTALRVPGAGRDSENSSASWRSTGAEAWGRHCLSYLLVWRLLLRQPFRSA